MTARRIASKEGLAPHWKIRLALPGALIHLASSSEPSWDDELYWTPIDLPAYGDTVGMIDWSAVIAVTWRYSE